MRRLSRAWALTASRADTLSEKQTTFFSNHSRTLDTEDEIILTSVGVDIGSSTSHLVYSKIVMDRRDNRYVVTSREVLFESDIMLTPYMRDTTIDAKRLQVFFERQYERAGIRFEDIDAGALILTGVAVRRRNARAIAELFAHEAGKFVAVSAGDSLETALVAFGSGAVALSGSEALRVMNVDIGGGTSKIAVCENDAIVDRTAIDVGARIICVDEDGRVSTIEEAGRRFASDVGIDIDVGDKIDNDKLEEIVELMAERLFRAMGMESMDDATASLLRLDPLSSPSKPDVLSFSGGVSEYIYGNESGGYGDLGPRLAAAVRRRVKRWGVDLRQPLQGIRATVIGASQYTVQLSGSTIFVQPDTTLPLRNLAVVRPRFQLAEDNIETDAVSAAISNALEGQDLGDGSTAIALYFTWHGSATFRRLDNFCRGIIACQDSLLAAGAPLVLVTDSDIGGLIGLHCFEVCQLQRPIVSIDGIVLSEFDYIDIGTLVDASGTVPVVIKSLVFPASNMDAA